MYTVLNAAATPQGGNTPLIVAANFGHTAIVQSLVAAGADMNTQDKVSTAPQPEVHPQTCNNVLAMNAVTAVQVGLTALILALRYGAFEAAEVLIKAGAGLSQQEEVMAEMDHDCTCVHP